MRVRLPRDAPAAAGIAIAVTAVAFAHGGYFPREWGWTLLALALAALLAVLARDALPVSPLETAAVALVVAFAAWTALTTAWSVSAAQPVLATERALVYAVALPSALLVTRGRDGAVLVGGVIAAATAVCAYALAARFVPGTLTDYPPPDSFQLQDPIGYWNGLAILAAVAAVAAATTVAEAHRRTVRGAAAACVPLLLAALYLTFSRGGLLALAVGLGAAVVLSRARLHLLAVLASLAPTAAVGVWFAARHRALTHAGASLATARSEGLRVGVVLLACVAVSAFVGARLLPLAEARIVVAPQLRRVIATLLGAAAVAVVAAVVVRSGGPADLASRVSSSFTSSVPATGGDLNRRLTSFSSDGRSDYWRVAWREVRAHPLLGGGAGSYERYWHRYRPTSYETQNAHNLYLETLAEEGPVGLLVLLAVFAVPFAAALRARGRAGVTAAAAGFAAFAFHAALDWDFQIVAVTLAALFCAAGILVASRGERPPLVPRPSVRYGTAAALVGLAAAAIAIQVGNSALSDGTDALDRGRLARAEHLGERARTWQPWSFEPWQLLGETSLAANDGAVARRRLVHALELDPQSATVWFDLAQASRGAARRQALAQARRLDPRGP